MAPTTDFQSRICGELGQRVRVVQRLLGREGRRLGWIWAGAKEKERKRGREGREAPPFSLERLHLVPICAQVEITGESGRGGGNQKSRSLD